MRLEDRALQADDKDFKNELGRVIDLEAWGSAKEAAAEQLKAARDAEFQQQFAVRSSLQKVADYNKKVSVLLLAETGL